MNSTRLTIDPQHANTIYVSPPSLAIQDAFVAKVDGTGSTVWATLLGGSDVDQVQAIASDT